MKKVIPALVLASVVLGGCAMWDKTEPSDAGTSANNSSKAPSAKPAPAGSTQLIVTPGDEIAGKVEVYNDAGRFVVLVFPIGHLPAVERRMFVYRQGLKVGELKITGPERENHTVGDVVAGEAQRGDDVREK